MKRPSRTVQLLAVVALSLAMLVGVFVKGDITQPHATAATSKNRARPPTGESKTGTWAGIEADGARGTYTVASMQFRVPTLVGHPGDSMGPWVGLGDGLTSPTVLVQAGVGSTLDDAGKQVNNPWWEVVPGDGSHDFPMRTITAGDTITVSLSSNLQGDKKDIFTLTDERTRDSSTKEVVGSSVLSDSASAECIVERHSATLAEFNPPSHRLTINNCASGTNANPRATAIDDFANHTVTMWDGSTELAGPGAISDGPAGSNFPVSWFNAA